MASSIGGTPRAAGELARRATVTGFAVACVLLGMRIPLPFVESHILQNPGGVLALGVAPFLSAFVIVEWAALAIPQLRRLRHGSIAERLLLTVPRGSWRSPSPSCSRGGW